MSELEQKAKHSWFRFHLQTAIVLSIVSGIFIWANVSLSAAFVDSGMRTPFRVYGFPKAFVVIDLHGHRKGREFFCIAF